METDGRCFSNYAQHVFIRMFLGFYCCYIAHVRNSMFPKYKIYFRTTAISVSTLILNTLFSSSSAAMRSCKSRVGSRAVVVKVGGSWAARSLKKLCFITVHSCHKISVCKEGRWVNLSIVSGARCIARETAALEMRRALMWALSISPMWGLFFCIINLLLAIIISFSS